MLILEQSPYDLLKITVGNEKIPIVRNGFSMINCRFGSMVIFSSPSGNLRLSVFFMVYQGSHDLFVSFLLFSRRIDKYFLECATRVSFLPDSRS